MSRRRIDGVAEPFDDGVDQRLVDDEGRRQQDVVAGNAFDGSAHRVDHEASRHRLALYARMQLQLRIEGLLAVAIGDKLEALKQAASAHVADEGMVAEPLVEPARQISALAAYI